MQHSFSYAKTASARRYRALATPLSVSKTRRETCAPVVPEQSSRQLSASRAPWITAWLLSLSALMAMLPGLSRAGDLQDHAQILQTAIEFVSTRTHTPGVRYEISAGQLDPRLRLPACVQPLQAALAPGAQVQRNTAIKVACKGKRPWSLYVRLQILSYGNIVVVQRPLKRTELVYAKDLRLEERELSTLPRGYLTALEQADGLSLRQDVSAGTPLRADILQRPRLITRGQSVTVIVFAGGLEVRTRGIALADAAAGDRLRVKSASKRIVEGQVSENGMVRVDK